MYAAKNAGKSQIVVYDMALQEEAVSRINIQKELQQAINNQELVLYLQPIVDISSGLTVSYEALMRWNHPEKGLVPPDLFIPIAESCNVIFELGYWAFEECSRIIRDENIDVPLSVNLSPKQFRDPNLIDRVKSTLTQYRIPEGSIEIEITESSFIEDIESALSIMNEFKECGISISLDDFGTGYSSLTLLQRLPAVKLKIDRSFIQDIITNDRDKNIVQGIVWTAQSLGLSVVAEGIENQEQLSFLREMKCNLGQGYFFSKPLPVSHYIN
ncbi:putative bifunctional diguanylate cyclase/phosphodiesterase [Shewanella aestuarii]